MPHSFFLCSQVSFIIRVRNCFNRYIFYYFQSIGFQPYTFHRIICQKSHLMYPQFAKNLRTYSIIALISKVSQANISVNGIRLLEVYKLSSFPLNRYHDLPGSDKQRHLFLLFQSSPLLYATAHHNHSAVNREYLR